jgi:hypothetical protein
MLGAEGDDVSRYYGNLAGNVIYLRPRASDIVYDPVLLRESRYGCEQFIRRKHKLCSGLTHDQARDDIPGYRSYADVHE